MTIPGGAEPQPDQALSGNLDWLRDVDEGFIRDRAQAQMADLINPSREGFLDKLSAFDGPVIGKALEAITGALFGSYDGDDPSLIALRDGQFALNDRLDLLSPLVDYGSVYMDAVGGFLQFGNNSGTMPFNRQIGPMRGCELHDGGIRLKDKGLWDLHAQLAIGENALNVGSGRVDWRIRVYTPDGTPFSTQTGFKWNTRRETDVIVSSVVVPEAGYVVKVEISWIHGSRELLGGPANTRLKVQHISRRTDVGGTGAEDSYIPETPPEEEEVEP